MYVIEVLPINRGFGKEYLSYFSTSPVIRGSIVKVPLRGKMIWALAINSDKAENRKSELKASTFALKKISESKVSPFFEENWINAVDKISAYFAVSKGSTMSSLLPAVILDNIQKVSKYIFSQGKASRKKIDHLQTQTKSEILCTQTDDSERWSHYRSAIREEFAKKHSVFLCLPTTSDINAATSYFERGIKDYTFVFHSLLPQIDLVDRWLTALREEHPILIIATAKWLCLPRKDLGTIILDKESNTGWKSQSRPYLDMRKAVEFIAREMGVRLIMGDSALRVETIWRYKNDEIFNFEPVKFRISSPSEPQLVHMKRPKMLDKKEFASISNELSELIVETKNQSKNLFIYTTRKGLASTTVCKDCGEEVLCHNCFSPMVLYKGTKSENVFRCHQCSSMRSAKEVCRKCGSWRLVPLGIGIEKVADELSERFPQVPSFVLSSDIATPSKALQIVEKFYKTPGCVLIGTEMALYYLRERVDFTAVVSIGSLFSVPDYKIREKIFHLILNLKMIARQKCLVQHWHAERATIELALSGNLFDFYKMEIEDRTLLQYPPFSVFVKITVRGGEVTTEKEGKFLTQYFDKWSPTVFPSVSERKGSRSAYNCVLKVPRAEWPNQEILEKVYSLPPQFEAKIDPDNLL